MKKGRRSESFSLFLFLKKKEKHHHVWFLIIISSVFFWVVVVIELEVLIGDVDEVKFGQLSSSEPNHHFSKPKILGFPTASPG